MGVRRAAPHRRRANACLTGLDRPLVPLLHAGNAFGVDQPVIERDEVVALLFNVSDIARVLDRIEILLGGDGGEEETDES